MLLVDEPLRFIWTREAFERADDAGVFDDVRVELIEGMVFQKTQLSPKQCVTLCLIGDELRSIFTPNSHVRLQAPLDVNERSQPVPHVAVVKGAIDDYSHRHPQHAELIVEVTLGSQFERTVKASVYSGAGVQEYWIANLEDDVVEIYRAPFPQLGYKQKRIARRGESISPLAAPMAVIEVDRILPQYKKSAGSMNVT